LKPVMSITGQSVPETAAVRTTPPLEATLPTVLPKPSTSPSTRPSAVAAAP